MDKDFDSIYQEFVELTKERLFSLGFSNLCDKKFLIIFSVCKVFEHIKNSYNIIDLYKITKKLRFAIVERICGEVLFYARNSGIDIKINKEYKQNQNDNENTNMTDKEIITDEKNKNDSDIDDENSLFSQFSDPIVKEIKEGEVAVVFDTSNSVSNSQRIDNIIDYLRNYGEDIFLSWRRIRW